MRKENLVNFLITAGFSSILTMVALAPIAYVANKNLPKRIASVDLQKLVEEEQEKAMKILGSGSLTDEQRSSLQKVTIEFAIKLSVEVEKLGAECACILVNKAALLGGGADDFTDLIRERMK